MCQDGQRTTETHQTGSQRLVEVRGDQEEAVVEGDRANEQESSCNVWSLTQIAEELLRYEKKVFEVQQAYQESAVSLSGGSGAQMRGVSPTPVVQAVVSDTTTAAAEAARRPAGRGKFGGLPKYSAETIAEDPEEEF